MLYYFKALLQWSYFEVTQSEAQLYCILSAHQRQRIINALAPGYPSRS